MYKIILTFLCFASTLLAKAQVSSCTYTGSLISSGTTGPAGDDVILGVTIPFTFAFYGVNYTNAQISTNGMMWLGTLAPNTGCCNGFTIPGDANIGAPYIGLSQTDWYPLTAAEGTIFYNTVGSSPNRIFVVHYHHIRHYSSGGSGVPSADTLTGEIQLYETTNEIRLVLEKATIPAGYVSTMGIAAGDGVTGVAVPLRNAAIYSVTNECWSLSSSSTVLPVTMVKFDAAKSGQSAVIDWATGIEENNGYFTIERSSNGSEYNRIATLKSKGNTQFGHQYTHTDIRPASGKNMYRLVQYDLDNKATHYGTRMLDFGEIKQVSFEPNPFSDQLDITIPGGSGNILHLTILDMYGRKVAELQRQLKESESLISISSREWAPGFYSVKLERDGQIENYKLIKK